MSEEGFIKTTTHNYVSRKSVIDGAKNVEIKGRSIVMDGVVVRGDLAVVRIGRYCIIESGTLLEPSSHPHDKKKRVPLVVGSHSRIGRNCQIRGAAIGSMCWIGDNVKVGKRCIIKDNVIIQDGTELGDGVVIPPFTRMSNKKTYIYQELPPSIAVQLQEVSISRFDEFKKKNRNEAQSLLWP